MYVEHLLMIGENAAIVDRFVTRLALLPTKDLSCVSKFLGTRVALYDDEGCTLDQEEAISDLLCTKGLADAISMRAPSGDKCYGIKPDDAELIEARQTSGLSNDTQVPIAHEQLVMGCAPDACASLA